MNEVVLPFLLVLILVGAFIRDNFVFSLLYLFAGVVFLGRLWSDRAVDALRVKRVFNRRVFLGEQVPVDLEVVNSGFLPAVWIRIVDPLPVEISVTSSFRQVFTLRGRQKRRFRYTLQARKRGRYPLGPVQLRSGDLFGLAAPRQRTAAPDQIIVYPKIVPMPNFSLVSRIPLGSLRIHQPIFEDPNRVVGKRAYQVGDSLRRVDWKATARTSQLQVKIYEPSISIQAAIFLNLNPDEYFHRRWIDATELGVITAASIANWLVEKRQAVGLATNGVDAFAGGSPPLTIPPRGGRDHLMRILETLAVVGISRGEGAQAFLQRESVHLSWGTTLILVSGSVDERTFDTLIQIRKRGLQVMILLVGTVKDLQRQRSRAYQAGMQVHHIFKESDLRTVGTLAGEPLGARPR